MIAGALLALAWGEPAPAPAPAPAPVLDPALEDRNELRGAGIALASVGVVSLGAAVGLQLAHAHRVDRCHAEVEDTGGAPQAYVGCERDALALRWGARFFQPVTVVFGLVGGGLLGKGFALTDAARGRPPQPAGAYAGGGAGLFGFAAVGYLATRILFLRDDFKDRCAHLGYRACARHNQLVIDGSADAFVLVMAYGGMMMTYGIAYARQKRTTNVAIAPAFGRGHAGLSVAGRF